MADFHRACAAADVEDGTAIRVMLDGVPVAIVRSDGEVYAIHDVCSHANVALSEGEIEDQTIECWLHGSRFDLVTGRPTGLPATKPVPVYPVKIDGDDILVACLERRTDLSTLEIRDLHVTVETEGGPREILRGVDLTVAAGETHAIMGPNGSGKSTLAYSIAGHPKYTVTGGTVTLDGADVLAMTVDERARAGLFLAMQYPVEVPGVSVSNFLRTAKTAVDGEAPKLRTWVKEVREAMERLAVDPSFAERSVNEGFSGGEKKRHEILQLELLKPKVAILDETDSGLDIDALKVVSEGVNRVRADGETGVLLITHYTRILRYIEPDFVHVFVRRPDRRGGWARARRPPRVRGLREVPAEGGQPSGMSPDRREHAAGRREDPQGLPGARARAAGRDTAGLPRQRQHLAEAAAGHRRDHRLLQPAQRQRRPCDARARRRVDRAVRGRPRQGRGLRRCEPPRGDRLHQELHRGAQPRRQRPRRGPGSRTASAPATRSSSPRWSTTPTSCRGRW